MRSLLLGLIDFVTSLLNQPMKVLWICLAVAFINLVVDGSLLQLWSLHRNSTRLAEQSKQLQTEATLLETKIEKASDPDFMERQARDRFDLVNEGDLVFVFSEE